MDAETTRFLIDQKLRTFNNICGLCMTWWTSSVVFCGAIVSGVWLKKDRIMELPYFRLLGAVLAVFFISLVLFGVFIFAYTARIDSELTSLLSTLGAPVGTFHTETLLLRLGITDATSSFLLIIVAWIVLWRMLARGRRRKHA